MEQKPVEEDINYILADLYAAGDINESELENRIGITGQVHGDALKMPRFFMTVAVASLPLKAEYTMFMSTVTQCNEALGHKYKNEPDKITEYLNYVSDEFKKRFESSLERLTKDRGFSPEAIYLLMNSGYFPDYIGENGWLVHNELVQHYYEYKKKE